MTTLVECEICGHICKENTELRLKVEGLEGTNTLERYKGQERSRWKLTKAKELLTRFVMANGREEAGLVEEAEQFLKETDK